MKTFIKSASLILAGAIVGVAGVQVVGVPGLAQAMTSVMDQPGGSAVAAEGEPKALYWVAPMDPNYRRDKPGQSPMGMDLIPVYEEGVGSGPDAGPGTIEVPPEVVNNLGVRTAEAKTSPLAFDVKTVGYVQYNEDSIVHVNPRIEGWIETLHVKSAGDPVEKGQPLYELYSPELVNAQEELIFALGQGDRRLQAASEARLKSFNVDGATLKQIKRERKVRQTVTFHAPVSGVVDDLTVRQGDYIKPGTTMMAIASLDEVWVEANVFERQSSLVKKGQKVRMTLDYLPGQEWEGLVDYIYPTLDPKTRTLKARMRFDNPDRALKPDMFATVSIQADDDTAVLNVPREAVIRGGESDRLVLALGEGRFKSIKVRTGRSDGQRMEILDGLSAGEEIVTSAQFLLDSESSKTSDFKRMNAGEKDMAEMSGMDHSQMAKKPKPEKKKAKPTHVWTEATINTVMPEELKVNVDHGPVPAWKWPSMTMDFNVGESVDMAALTPGMTVQIEIAKREAGGFEISDVATGESAVPSEMDSEHQHDHSSMKAGKLGGGS